MHSQAVLAPEAADPAGISSARLHTSQGWKLRVHNQGGSPVIAIHATFRCAAHDGFGHSEVGFSYDQLYNYGLDQVIAPGAFSAFPLSPEATTCPGGVDAVIFEDGHSAGDAAEIANIYERRTGASEAALVAREQMDRIAGKLITAPEVSALLRTRAKALSVDKTKSPAERQGEIFAFTLVSSLLDSQSEWQVPSDSTPQKQPSIQEMIASSALQPEQAHATVLRRKLDEWRANLEGHLQPAPGK